MVKYTAPCSQQCHINDGVKIHFWQIILHHKFVEKLTLRTSCSRLPVTVHTDDAWQWLVDTSERSGLGWWTSWNWR